jgi:superfamily II DNA or RNA helicase
MTLFIIMSEIIKPLKGSYLSEKGYVVKISNLTDEELNTIKNDLSVTPAIMGGTQKDHDKLTYELFNINKKYISFPIYYGIHKFGIPKVDKFEPDKEKIKFTGTLRDYQVNIIKICKTHLDVHRGGLLVVPCGVGKTTMAIKIASLYGLKTLILTHKTFLQDQWVKSIKKFTKSEVGIMRQDIVDVEGKGFVVGMIQSLSKRNYDESILKQFGLVICDECHHFASKSYAKALSKVGARYTVGLSATPYRNDGLMRVVNWYLGDIMFNKRQRTNNQVMVKNITYYSDSDLFKEKKRYILGKTRPDSIKMLSNLVKIDSRNNNLINIINTLRKNPERKILILSDRKEHLIHLKTKVNEYIQLDIDSGKILENECRTYLYTGDVKKNDRYEAETYADILFATYPMAHEGLDVPRLNTVILATSKKDVVQSVGRCLRNVLKEGDIRPLVINFIDYFSIYINQNNERDDFFLESKYVQDHYFINDEKIMSEKKFFKNLDKQKDGMSKTKPKSFDEMLSIPLVDIIDDSDTNRIDEQDEIQAPRKKNHGKKTNEKCDIDPKSYRKKISKDQINISMF